MPARTDLIDYAAQSLLLVPAIVATANARVPIVAGHISRLESKQLDIPLIVSPPGRQTRQQKAAFSCRRMETKAQRKIAASHPTAIHT